MSTILFLLLLFFVIIPLFKSAIAIYRARRAARQFFNSFRQQASGTHNRQPNHAPQETKQKKKINPEDGEFVQFEDLPPEDSNSQKTYTEIKVEQQIVDVEWEDIKS